MRPTLFLAFVVFLLSLYGTPVHAQRGVKKARKTKRMKKAQTRNRARPLTQRRMQKRMDAMLGVASKGPKSRFTTSFSKKKTSSSKKASRQKKSQGRKGALGGVPKQRESSSGGIHYTVDGKWSLATMPKSLPKSQRIEMAKTSVSINEGLRKAGLPVARSFIREGSPDVVVREHNQGYTYLSLNRAARKVARVEIAKIRDTYKKTLSQLEAQGAKSGFVLTLKIREPIRYSFHADGRVLFMNPVVLKSPQQGGL